MPNFGTVYWITGLSGAGKTTVGKELYQILLAKKERVLFLDGDELRDAFGDIEAYSFDERFKLSMKYSRFCRLLSLQGMDVICATISMFHECRKWNRENFFSYKEIYLQVPLEILVQRDSKLLYSRALQGKAKNVMGIDLSYEEPLSPDLIMANDGKHTPREMALQIIEKLNLEVLSK